jgi:cyanate permease
MEALGVALGICWFALNVAASLAALLTTRFPRQQRLLQVLLTWAVPVVGAVLVLYFTTESDKPVRPRPYDLANHYEGPAGSGGGSSTHHHP